MKGRRGEYQVRDILLGHDGVIYVCRSAASKGAWDLISYHQRFGWACHQVKSFRASIAEFGAFERATRNFCAPGNTGFFLWTKSPDKKKDGWQSYFMQPDWEFCKMDEYFPMSRVKNLVERAKCRKRK